MVTTALYAGDTKIFNCIGSEEDCLALQGTLSNMEHWIKVNNNYCVTVTTLMAYTFPRC